MASVISLAEWDKDPKLYLFTSLTAGSSHIVTATSRLETILKANKVPFLAIDTATNAEARSLWGRRARGKKLPGLVKEGFVIGDLEEVEEWNEYGELKENIGDLPSDNTPTPATKSAVSLTPAKKNDDPTAGVQSSLNNLQMKEAASQAANIGAARKGPTPGITDTKVKPLPSSLAEADAATKPETMNSSSASKNESIRTAEDTATLASDVKPDTEDKPATDAAKSASVTQPVSDDKPASAPAGIESNDNIAAVSAVESTDDLSESVTPAGGINKTHRGSSVSIASEDEIKKVEQSAAIPEGDEDEEDEDAGDGSTTPKTQTQDSAAADKAAVSVED